MNRKFFSFIVMTALFAATATDTFSQVQGKVRGGFDTGFIRKSENGGGSIGAINLGYNIQDNMNVGIKCEIAQHYGKYKYDNMNFVSTYTYYFGSGAFPFIPFVGCGGGLYVIFNDVFSYMRRGNMNSDIKIGGLLIAGYEFGKFRVTAEYNLIPASEETILKRETLSNEKIKNSYLAITVGFYFGGGKRMAADKTQ